MKLKKRVKEVNEMSNVLNDIMDSLMWVESFANDARIKQFADELIGDVDHINDKVENYKIYLEDVRDEIKEKKKRYKQDIEYTTEEAVECFA